MKRKHTDDDDYLPTKKAKFDDGKQDEIHNMNINNPSNSTTLLNLPFDTLNIITEYVINDQENPDTRYKIAETCTVFHERIFLECIKDRIEEAYSPINETTINALQKLCNLVIISPQFAAFNDRFGEDIIEQIIKAALDNSSHEDWQVRQSSLQLFRALFHKNQGFDAAITAAAKNSSHEDWRVRQSSLQLFRALFHKNQGFDAAITAAAKNSSHEDWRVRESSLQLFNYLVQKDQGFDAAITAATQNSLHQERSIRNSALHLFSILINKDQGFDAAITAATLNSSHEDIWVRDSALRLFTDLVQKDQGFDAAIQAATKNSSHQEWDIWNSALQLFSALLDKNYHPAYEIAKKIELPDQNSLKYEELQDAIQAYEQRNPSSWSCLIQ